MRRAGVRKRFTPEDRSRILADYRASGLSQRAFAARVGISLACLSIWLGRAREHSLKKKEISFLELPGLSVPRPACTVRFRTGVSLEVPPGFARGELKDLLELLREL